MKCIEDEIPFELPDGWAWARLGVICPYGENKAVSADLIDETAWILDLEDIEKETGVIKKYTTKSERNSVSNKYSFCKGQLLYSKLRPYLNKVVIATKDGYCTTEILPLTFYGNIYSPYMQLFIMSPTFLTYVNMISYGVKMPRLGTNDGKNAIIAIPPINEQKRIRDKFDIVAPLFDKIQNNLNNLNNEVTAIKSKILDLAIRGKLVPQDPNDEPASVLLERIREEKEELIKQGKIKRDKMESVIFKGDDNSYYQDLPNGWSVCKLCEISYFERGITFPASAKEAAPTGRNIACARTANVQDSFDISNLIYVDKSFMKDNPDKFLKVNDIIVSTANSLELVGKSCIVEKLLEKMTFGGFVTVIRGIGINHKYIHMCLKNKFLKGEFSYKSTQTTNIANISTKDLAETLIYLPPLAEQRRIVNTIEALFAQIDKIVEQIS